MGHPRDLDATLERVPAAGSAIVKESSSFPGGRRAAEARVDGAAEADEVAVGAAGAGGAAGSSDGPQAVRAARPHASTSRGGSKNEGMMGPCASPEPIENHNRPGPDGAGVCSPAGRIRGGALSGLSASRDPERSRLR